MCSGILLAVQSKPSQGPQRPHKKMGTMALTCAKGKESGNTIVPGLAGQSV